jgi:putative tryptophan/tyrosine transport system substrate-binding protein
MLVLITVPISIPVFLSVLCLPAHAQEAAKVPKIGWLGARPAALATGLEGLRRELRALGYVEGKNIAFESRYADNKVERLPALADELVRLKVDVIVTPSTPEALTAKNATRAIPIVFINVADPLGAGLVETVARPGGNITGFTNIAAELAGKRLELLKETIPNLSRVAVLWNPQDPGSTRQWKESQRAARELGLQLHSMEVSSANDFDSAFKEESRRVAPLSPSRRALYLFKNGSRTSQRRIACRQYTIRLLGSGEILSRLAV